MRRIAMLGPLVFLCSAEGVLLACTAADTLPPPLLLAEVYDAGTANDLTAFWVSEKLDGVRAYWDGNQLLTRSGLVIAAPSWFTKGWPAIPLDGELWGGRGSFQRTSGIIRRIQAADEDWIELSYRVFDLPAEPGPFDQRLARLTQMFRETPGPTIAAVEQRRVVDPAQLSRLLAEVERGGGEGLMLHRGDSLYVAGRSEHLLKYKSYEDAEALVVEHVPGNGKYTGMLGALVVERADGARFKVGSGFSDRERRDPPPVGSLITYAYNGLTEAGIPRFARFVRLVH